MAEHHPSTAEAALEHDLRSLAASAGQDWFAFELYRALAQRRWRREADGAVAAPSWTLAERIVNELRERDGAPPLTLAQTGEEGTVPEEGDPQLRARGWVSDLRDPDRHDDAHDAVTAQPERFTPAGTEW